ncbi:hypothetical protein RUND412_000289 [Rhizina undulata]
MSDTSENFQSEIEKDCKGAEEEAAKAARKTTKPANAMFARVTAADALAYARLHQLEPQQINSPSVDAGVVRNSGRLLMPLWPVASDTKRKSKTAEKPPRVSKAKSKR